ncbi:hypothetical protein FSP39_003605 [Pinctada imbricata]|uniref:Uncharacterized protein n=1 Tax=Pinctada imbricata TaxID=66713 RepID=A0AA89BUG6_PINIB|nr:hypothetical protein FSP39_003605 [Pinctada imbricata]
MPLTIVNIFRASGIYPVDNQAISDDDLRPGFTFTTSSGLGLLAEAASSLEEETPCLSGDTSARKQYEVSEHISEVLIFPSAPVKAKQPRLLDSLPNNLTSKECIREVARDLNKVKQFAEKEKRAKDR